MDEQPIDHQVDHPVEQFDPLLRNLLAWRLVEETSDGWCLRKDVAERVGKLASTSHRSTASERVYFGHACARCHSSGLTRLQDGQYLCDPCRQAIELESVATALPVPQERGKRRFAKSRAHPLAS